MKTEGVSRKDLADRLNKSKGCISQLLDGTANMTIRTMSDMLVALGRKFHPTASPLNEHKDTVVQPGATSVLWTTGASIRFAVPQEMQSPPVVKVQQV